MKNKKLYAVGLLALSITAYSQAGITINGNVNNIDDGTVIEFFLIDGLTGSLIASDTISDHRFTLSIPDDRDDMFDDDVCGLIHGVGAGISPIALPITGNNGHYPRRGCKHLYLAGGKPGQRAAYPDGIYQ